MLPSKIEDFPKLWPSKRPSKFHPFSHRFLIDFGSVLVSNMGPSWEPRRLKIRKNGPQKFRRWLQKAVRNMIFLQNIVLNCFDIDFLGGRARFSKIFGWFWEVLGLVWECFRLLLLGGLRSPRPPQTLGMFSAAFINFGMIFELLGLLWACFRLLLLGGLRGMFSVALAGGLSMLFCTYAARIRKLAKDEKPNKD